MGKNNVDRVIPLYFNASERLGKIEDYGRRYNDDEVNSDELLDRVSRAFERRDACEIRRLLFDFSQMVSIARQHAFFRDELVWTFIDLENNKTFGVEAVDEFIVELFPELYRTDPEAFLYLYEEFKKEGQTDEEAARFFKRLDTQLHLRLPIIDYIFSAQTPENRMRLVQQARVPSRFQCPTVFRKNPTPPPSDRQEISSGFVRSIQEIKDRIRLKPQDLKTGETRKQYLERTLQRTGDLADYLDEVVRLSESLDDIIASWEAEIRIFGFPPGYQEEILKTRSLAHELRKEYLSEERLSQKRAPRTVRTVDDLRLVTETYSKAEKLAPEAKELLRRSLEKVVAPKRIAELLRENPGSWQIPDLLSDSRFSDRFLEETASEIARGIDSEKDPVKLLREYSIMFDRIRSDSLQHRLSNALIAKIRSFPPNTIAELFHLPPLSGKERPLDELVRLINDVSDSVSYFSFPHQIRDRIVAEFLDPEKLLGHFRLRYPATALPDIDCIEKVRIGLNRLREKLGDRTVFQIGLSSLEEPITRRNIAARIRTAAGFTSPNHYYPVDVEKLYQTIARFHGTKVAEWLVAHQEDLDELFSDEVMERFLGDLNRLGVEVTFETPWYEKAWDHLKKGEIAYIIRRGIDKLNNKNFNEEEFDGRSYDYQTVRPLKQGFYLESLRRDGAEVGTIIRGRPAEGARLDLEVTIDETTGKDSLRQKYGGRYAAGAAAVYSSAGRKPAFLSMNDGRAESYFLSDKVDGLAIALASGAFLLSDLDQFTLPDSHQRLQIDLNAVDFFRFDDWCRDQKCDAFQSHLLVHEGENRVDRSTSRSTTANRRLLVTFKDGSFGLVDFPGHLTLYETAYLALKIPGLRSAINLDTGNYDTANYQLPSGEVVKFAENYEFDSLPNKVIFYTANQPGQR
ncbi:MAG: hypothetical protein HY539_06170 [Deltaproteobacteria bacterium]|nr:hypothetical protein [Deltaproteobacteria bacterium]